LLELGRQVYNFRCYFCHGYSGDAKTVAAQVLDPRPRDFTQAQDLDAPTILKRIMEGKAGTAMKSFNGILSQKEMLAVSAFVMDEFVNRRARNTAYHTPENGWPDHKAKYGAAYPFVLGEVSLDQPEEPAATEAATGRRLFLSACVTCHEPKAGSANWEAFPLSHMGEIIRDPVDLVSRASVYGLHDRPFELAGLSEKEKKGKDLYDANCAFCHARDGTGKNWIGSFLEPHPRNFTDPAQTAHLTPERLAKVMREGLPETSMPAWGNVLTEEDIAAVAAYLRRAFIPSGKPARPARSTE
jgi:cytochrome c oxidase cbb3-type subunit III